MSTVQQCSSAEAGTTSVCSLQRRTALYATGHHSTALCVEGRCYSWSVGQEGNHPQVRSPSSLHTMLNMMVALPCSALGQQGAAFRLYQHLTHRQA